MNVLYAHNVIYIWAMACLLLDIAVYRFAFAALRKRFPTTDTYELFRLALDISGSVMMAIATVCNVAGIMLTYDPFTGRLLADHPMCTLNLISALLISIHFCLDILSQVQMCTPLLIHHLIAITWGIYTLNVTTNPWVLSLGAFFNALAGLDVVYYASFAVNRYLKITGQMGTGSTMDHLSAVLIYMNGKPLFNVYVGIQVAQSTFLLYNRAQFHEMFVVIFFVLLPGLFAAQYVATQSSQRLYMKRIRMIADAASNKKI